MKYFMSRFGGHALIIGKGKASNSELPKDQSLDYMLDNYAKEVIPNYFYISSYDAKPEWMGSMERLDVPKPVKLGTLEHDFNEVLMQYSVSAITDIYISYHHWPNVYAILIKTHKNEIKEHVSEYTATYDYVLQVFVRSKNEDSSLKNRPKDIERILLILFYKMGLIYEDNIEVFRPSKTHYGKLISPEFVEDLPQTLIGIESDEALAELLKQYPNYG